jgi:putative transposase
VPPELQQRVHATVEETRRRSRWRAGRTLQILGISRTSYYRWLREEAWARPSSGPAQPVQPYEALSEEKAAVVRYALQHPEIRHRELSWRMIDEDVAYLSASTVYRILAESNLMHRRGSRSKRYREEVEKAQRPDERWGTDLMHLRIGGATYYFTAFIDEYSRHIVHWELLDRMDGPSVSLSAQSALEKLRRDGIGKLAVTPEIRSDNGSSYISREFHGVLEHYGLSHYRIKPHCPEENGIMERANRTVREALEECEVRNRLEAERELGRIIEWYNGERLHSSLGYLRPMDYYRGRPSELHEARRRKLSQARHHRKETNLQLRQRTLPLDSTETVSSGDPNLCH